ncbi:hypothetical protein CEXT_628511, partial [Caerostris extrusa]
MLKSGMSTLNPCNREVHLLVEEASEYLTRWRHEDRKYAEPKKNVLWEGLKFGTPERDKLKTSLGSVPDIRVDSSRLKCFLERSNSSSEEQKINKKKIRKQRESTGEFYSKIVSFQKGAHRLKDKNCSTKSNIVLDREGGNSNFSQYFRDCRNRAWKLLLGIVLTKVNA